MFMILSYYMIFGDMRGYHRYVSAITKGAAFMHPGLTDNF